MLSDQNMFKWSRNKPSGENFIVCPFVAVNRSFIIRYTNINVRKVWNVTNNATKNVPLPLTFKRNRCIKYILISEVFSSSADLFRLHTTLIYKHAHRETAVVGFTTKSEIRAKVLSNACPCSAVLKIK